jgi:hypothetical protein
MVHVRKNAAATATTTSAATTRKAILPMRVAREDRRAGTAVSSESVVIVENSFG